MTISINLLMGNTSSPGEHPSLSVAQPASSGCDSTSSPLRVQMLEGVLNLLSPVSCPSSPLTLPLDGFYFEVQRDEREHKAFEILDEIVEVPQSFWILAGLYLLQRSQLIGGEGDVISSDGHLEFLFSACIREGPVSIISFQDMAVTYDFSKFVDHGFAQVHFFSYPSFSSVSGGIGVLQDPFWMQLEFQEFVSKSPLLRSYHIDGEGHTFSSLRSFPSFRSPRWTVGRMSFSLDDRCSHLSPPSFHPLHFRPTFRRNRTDGGKERRSCSSVPSFRGSDTPSWLFQPRSWLGRGWCAPDVPRNIARNTSLPL
eukprot:CAMPEP_0113922624 /NCGR_PEP_ID=MMETSP1159-20121227/1708_1 /TAXON_ID=88271 /ORGANISM="Picocystis salinarum" /LENGTH=311 /DNA_ID=CAMNT_0000922737 /DNA_START=882 /DNA_END=1815 /DNA_ORIENTATION=- /assembly_acc=CAM_ASM_000767